MDQPRHVEFTSEKCWNLVVKYFSGYQSTRSTGFWYLYSHLIHLLYYESIDTNENPSMQFQPILAGLIYFWCQCQLLMKT